jgi:hypothetical protein
MTPVFDTRRRTRIGSAEGRGGGPADRTPRSRWTCSGVSGLEPGAQQLAAVEVVEHQGGWFDPDPDPAPAEDLRGQDDVLAQRHAAGSVDGPLDLDRITVLDRR